jgi:DNA polymerase III subunit epsilon
VFPTGPFVAIDFETADAGPDSACAVGLVRVDGGVIVERAAALIRPPRPRVWYTRVHGITWEMVKGEPPFAEVWGNLRHLLAGATTLVAHNASFDRRVLAACCATGGISVPELPFVCTVQVARRRWGQRPNDLASVCRRLGIPLRHHDALSDAEAAARILLAAAAPPPGY